MTDTTRSSHPALSMTDNVAMSTEDFLLLAGRILLAWIFLRSGWGKIGDIAGYSAGFPARGAIPGISRPPGPTRLGHVRQCPNRVRAISPRSSPGPTRPVCPD